MGNLVRVDLISEIQAGNVSPRDVGLQVTGLPTRGIGQDAGNKAILPLTSSGMLVCFFLWPLTIEMLCYVLAVA